MASTLASMASSLAETFAAKLKLGIASSPDESSTTYKPVPFGKEMLKEFMFDPAWININNGSFGAAPRAVKEKQLEMAALCESAPDLFIRYTYPKLLDESRVAVAKVLNVPTSTCVFVPNATTGINTVLRNLVWNEDGKDEILYFSTIYGACQKTIEYVSEYTGRVQGRGVPVSYPVEDEILLELFKEAITASRNEGKNPRAAVFDSISSQPGLCVPFEALIKICSEEGIFSIVDGAHGIGQIHLDLSALDPDFFVSNLHKWLHVPRGCAVLYVPERHQALIRTPLPTSHGFIPKGQTVSTNPLPKGPNSDFVSNFEMVGTIDNTNYVVAAEAIKWRQEVCGGEDAIIKYNIDLARNGSQAVAEILGTKVVDNSTQTLTQCALANVVLPLKVGDGGIQKDDVFKALNWMCDTALAEYKTFVPFMYQPTREECWVRLSAQIYLDQSDFETVGKMLLDLSERVKKGEYLADPK